MVDATMSGCINHPGVEAVARCKQCGKPVCGTCVVTGPTGRFCCDTCKDKHEKFVQRAQDMQRTSKRTGDMARLRSFLVKLVIVIVGLCVVGYAVAYLEVPVAGDLARKIFGFVSPYLPFLH